MTIEPEAVTSAKILDGSIANIDLDKINIPLSGFGSASADVDMGSNKITSLENPTLAQDAVTKSYVDDEITIVSDSLVFLDSVVKSHDSLFVDVYDSLYLHDSLLVNVFDTIRMHDSILVNVVDTIRMHDSLFVNVFDTIRMHDSMLLTHRDSLRILDSLYGRIVDTVAYQEELLTKATFNLNEHHVYVGDANDTARGVPVTGAISLNSTGLTRLSDGIVHASNLANNASGIALDNGTADHVLASRGDGSFKWTSPDSLSVDPSNIALSEAYIFVGNSFDNAEAQPLSGDATITNAGVLTIGTGAVTSAKILDGSIANIDLDKTNIPLSGFASASADVDMGSNKITSLAAPTLADDAATKLYVDEHVDADADATNEIQDISISGNSINISLGGTGFDLTTTPPINGQLLGWDGSAWIPVDDNDTTYTAGDGLSLTTSSFSLKNSANLDEHAVPRWNNANTQLTNSSIWDDNAGHVLIGDDGTGTISSSYNLQVVGTFKTEQIYHSSDKRWKTDILTIDNALTKVQQLRGVEYKWRQDEFPEKQFTDGTQIGLIAQEVEAVVPELVMTDNSGYKSVEYANLVAVLIEAVKEQQELIDAQQEKISALETENSSMQTEIAELQNMQSQIDELQSQVASMNSVLEMLQPSANAK
ncbi:MAG: tail fiber domain-containing protein [Bacteroidales bacterium]